MEPRFKNRTRLHGEFNAAVDGQRKPGSVTLVDGKVVDQVRCVNTKTGVVETNVVFPDGEIKSNRFVNPETGTIYMPEDFPGRNVHSGPGEPNVIWETITGEVEFWDAEHEWPRRDT